VEGSGRWRRRGRGLGGEGARGGQGVGEEREGKGGGAKGGEWVVESVVDSLPIHVRIYFFHAYFQAKIIYTAYSAVWLIWSVEYSCLLPMRSDAPRI
jgi:hypothetical protein